MARSKEEMFAHYKDYILKGDRVEHPIRFNVVQYVCSFPAIDPYEMAAAIVRGGYQIAYETRQLARKKTQNTQER